MAISFNGSTQEISCGTFTGPTTASVSLWLNPDNVSSDRRVLGNQNQWEMRITATAQILNDFGHVAASGFASSPISAGVWTHVLMTYSIVGGVSVQQNFINGVLNATGAPASSTPSAAVLLLGHRTGSGAAAHYSGLMEDVRFYNRVLSANEATVIYQARGADRITFGLLNRFRMKEGVPGAVVTRAYDSVGTIIGTPIASPIYSTTGGPTTTRSRMKDG